MDNTGDRAGLRNNIATWEIDPTAAEMAAGLWRRAALVPLHRKKRDPAGYLLELCHSHKQTTLSKKSQLSAETDIKRWTESQAGP